MLSRSLRGFRSGWMGKWKLVLASALVVLAGGIGGGLIATGQAKDEAEDPPYAVARALTEEEAAAGVPVEAQYFDSFEEALRSIGADPQDFAVTAPDKAADMNQITDPPSDQEPTRHCTVQIEPLRPGAVASETSAPVCFDTFEEALESIGADADEFEAR